MRPLPATILIVEDEPVIASAMQESLQRAGAQVLVASCIQEAIMLCSRNKPEIALLNTGKMPDKEGVAFADMLYRHFGIWPLIVTGTWQQDNPDSNSGAAKWPVLYKPFTIPQLLRFVAERAPHTSDSHPTP